jgi:C4-dicarboxylate-binding protein DctP
MKTKGMLSLLLAGVLSIGLVGCGADAGSSNPDSGKAGGEASNEPPIVLKFSHVTAPESVKGKAAAKFAELAAAKTNNRVKVEVYPSSQLYGDKDELDALISGNVQMIAPSVTKMVKLDPRWQYVDMPYLFRDQEHAQQFFNSDIATSLLNGQALLSNDIKGLAFWENGFKHFSNNERPLAAPADFNGLKFRAQAGKVLEAQFTTIGAGSATIPFGETYAALQQGTVDGQENTFNNIDTQKYQEVQKYLTVSAHGRLDYAIFVNNTFWEGLPEDVRTQLEAALQEATEYEWTLAGEDNKKSFENLKTSGKMEVRELTTEEKAALEQAFQPVYEEFGSVITPELINGIRDLK